MRTRQITLAKLGMTVTELRAAVSSATAIREQKLRRIILFAGKFWAVLRWERGEEEGSAESFELLQVIAGEGESWQQRKLRTARTGVEGLADLDGLAVSSPDGGRWRISESASLVVTIKGTAPPTSPALHKRT